MNTPINKYNKNTSLYSSFSIRGEDREDGENNSIQKQKIF